MANSVFGPNAKGSAFNLSCTSVQSTWHCAVQGASEVWGGYRVYMEFGAPSIWFPFVPGIPSLQGPCLCPTLPYGSSGQEDFVFFFFLF